MTAPLCSVIIPAFNAGNYMEEALNSIFMQTYRPLEVIVVDDGSTDKTAEVIKNYQNRNMLKQDRLIYIYQKNSGPSSARNAGIKEAKGKYTLFLDCDDKWPEGKLERQIGLMERHPDTGLLFGDSCRFTEEGLQAATMFQKNGYDRKFFGHDFYVQDAYAKLLCNGNFITTGSVVFKKECLKETGCFDEGFRHSEDVDLWLRIALVHPVAYSTDLYLLRRIHGDNASDNYETMYLGFIEVIKKHSRLFAEKIKQNKINISRCFRKKYFELGYYFFLDNKFQKAREYFRQSLGYGFHFKTFLYFVLASFKPEAVESARRVKGMVTR